MNYPSKAKVFIWWCWSLVNHSHSVPDDQTPQASLRLSNFFLKFHKPGLHCLHHSYFQADIQQSTKLWVLNSFSSPKFQSPLTMTRSIIGISPLPGTNCILRVSINVIKLHDQKQLGEEFISAYIYILQAITEGSQGRNSNRAGMWRQQLMQRTQRSHVAHDLLSLLSYIFPRPPTRCARPSPH